MTDPFAPPPIAEPRPRPALCRAYAPTGERCDLYWDHYGVHRDHSRHLAWVDEDTWADA